MIITIAVCVVVVLVGVRFIYFTDFAKVESLGNSLTADRPMPTATLPAVVASEEITAAATATVQPTPQIIIATVEVVREVPIEVTRLVTEYREVFETVEVERVVEIPFYITPTPTSTPVLPAGSVQICIRAHAVKEVYINQLGVIDGACQIIQTGDGATIIPVQVNR